MDRYLFGAFAEDPFQGTRLDHIADGSRSAMRVHIAHVIRGKFRVLDGSFHDTVSAVAILGGLRNVVGVAGHALADDFSEDALIPLLRGLQRLQNPNSRALADD